jgi:AmpE protein
MKFVIILICLAVERYTHLGHYLNRFCCFQAYADFCRKQLEKAGVWRSELGMVFTVIPLLIVTAIIYYSLQHLAHNLVGRLLALIILLYCLGPQDIYTLLSQYFSASQRGNTESARESIEPLLPHGHVADSDLCRAVTFATMTKFNDGIFAVVFWFVILGPVGAVLYRSIAMTQEWANLGTMGDSSLARYAKLCKDILDWIPVRLLALGFALMGNFMNTFNYWLRNFLTRPEENHDVLINTGLIALEIDHIEAKDAVVEENKLTLALIDRTTVLYLIVLALITLGTFL